MPKLHQQAQRFDAHAISSGGLLDAAHSDEDDYHNHEAATDLLYLLERQIRGVLTEAEEAPGTDLSVFLSVWASDSRKEKRRR